jgi:hypothetical protein
MLRDIAAVLIGGLLGHGIYIIVREMWLIPMIERRDKGLANRLKDRK